MKLVSIVIVTWNGLSWLKICLPSLQKQRYRPIEIIVVDNASTDGSTVWVKKHYPHIRVVSNTTNLGFAQGNNEGYSSARGDYILFLNNDTKVTPDFIIELVKKIESRNDIGGVQSKLLLMDDPKRLDAVGAYLTPTGFLFHWGFGQLDGPKYDATEYLYTAKGACMMFRRDVLHAVMLDGNIFDPSYFAYFEETDLCHRIWLAGYTVTYAPKSVIYHKMGGTSTGMDNAFIQYHSFKNRIATYLKNFGVFSLFTILPVHILMCEAFSFVSFLQGKFRLGWAIQQAIWWNILHVFDTFHFRYLVQHHIRKIPDGQFFHLIMKKPLLIYYVALAQGKSYEA